MCVTWYPACSDPKHPRPSRLCRRACEQLQDDYCQAEYDYQGDLSYIRELLPVCDNLPDEEEDPECILLGEFAHAQISAHVTRNCHDISNPKRYTSSYPKNTVP